MRIIDSHTHLGQSRVTDSNYTEELWLKTMERYGLSGIMSYSLPNAYPDPFTVHNRIHEFSKAHPGKIWGVVDVNPCLDRDEYEKEVTRCIKELGFVAIKLHPYYDGCYPLSKHCDKVFEIASALDKPVIVHTGPGVPVALPSLMMTRAKQFPTVKIVLAHAGAHIYCDEAVIAAEHYENIYLEPSWCGAHQIQAMINKCGIERVLYGSDLPNNVGPELAKVEAINLTGREAELYLSGNAINLYGLK